MIHYWPLKSITPATTRKRIINGLGALRELISQHMPKKTVYDTLILGTWNIRNFDDNRFAHGPRLDDAIYFIAETLSAFDVIAIQEICRDLQPLRRVMELLGDQYDLIITDVTEGPSGASERNGFIYNRNKVKFRNIAGEIVLPFKQQISDVTKKRQFARTPYSCSFRAGWFNFVFSSVHIYYGKQSKNSPEYKRRVNEIAAVAKFISNLAKKEKDNYILVGDFNIDAPGDPTFNALKEQGFELFQNKTGSNMKQNKFYDQISWLSDARSVRQTPGERNQGVLKVFDAVFREDDFSRYRKQVTQTLQDRLERAQQALTDARASNNAKEIRSAQKSIDTTSQQLGDDALMRKYYLEDWRTFQISDHLPLWVELDINFSGEYLEELKKL